MTCEPIRELLAKNLPTDADQEIIERLARNTEAEGDKVLSALDYLDVKLAVEAGNVRAGIGRGADPVRAAEDALQHIADIHDAAQLAIVLNGKSLSYPEATAVAKAVCIRVDSNVKFALGAAEEDAEEYTVVVLAGGGA